MPLGAPRRSRSRWGSNEACGRHEPIAELGRPSRAARFRGCSLVCHRRTNAPDEEILAWAREHGFVVVTNDLDFSAILAATSGRAPSVVQIRMQDLLSDTAVNLVARALEVYREDVDGGALLSIDESGTRMRMLPLRRSGDRP
jgi:predicted nuclease of predicted toxin-antitoxin system